MLLSSVTNTTYWIVYHFSNVQSCLLYHSSIDHRGLSLFLVFYSALSIYISVFVPYYTVSMTVTCSIVWSQRVCFLQLCLSFSRCFGYLGSLYLNTNFRKFPYSYPPKNVIVNLIRIALISYVAWDIVIILTTLIPQIKSIAYFYIHLCCIWLLPSASYSFQSTGFMPPHIGLFLSVWK